MDTEEEIEKQKAVDVMLAVLDIQRKKDSKKKSTQFYFNILFSIIGTLALVIFNSMSNSLERTETNVHDLNVKMAIVVSNNNYFKEELDDFKVAKKDLEKRVRFLEKN